MKLREFVKALRPGVELEVFGHIQCRYIELAHLCACQLDNDIRLGIVDGDLLVHDVFVRKDAIVICVAKEEC